MRWALFAKLINILVYEILTNRELCPEKDDWQRRCHWIHVPMDSIVVEYLHDHDRTFPTVSKFKGMTKQKYKDLQDATRKVAKKDRVDPIWFEAAWSLERRA